VSDTSSKEEILTSLRKFYVDYGRSPRRVDLGGAGLPTGAAISRVFGSLRSACDAAGFPPEGRESLGERMPWPEKYFGVKNDQSK
jgi:hypothetical protein